MADLTGILNVCVVLTAIRYELPQASSAVLLARVDIGAHRVLRCEVLFWGPETRNGGCTIATVTVFVDERACGEGLPGLDRRGLLMCLAELET